MIIINNRDVYKAIAEKIYTHENVLYIGRGIDSASCMEGSLKLKEISYIHSEAYAAGELKHGTISLVDQGTPVITIATVDNLYEKTISNLKETKAPPGYQLDDTKYWFCFCDEIGNSCETCDEVSAGLDATRIPFEQIGKVNATNQLINYDLPATGGPGVYPLILVSVLFIVTPLVYRFIRRRKRERRGVG